jgi:hypothetical protein
MRCAETALVLALLLAGCNNQPSPALSPTKAAEKAALMARLDGLADVKLVEAFECDGEIIAPFTGLRSYEHNDRPRYGFRFTAVRQTNVGGNAVTIPYRGNVCVGNGRADIHAEPY